VSDEAILIVVLLGGIAVMCVALLRYQKHKEARLAARTEIEVPIQSVLRSVLIILPAMVVGPVLMAVVGAKTDPWGRQHALAATLLGIGLGVAGMLAGVRLSRRYARVGVLRYTPTRLELEVAGERRSIDLDEPYELAEGSAEGPTNMRLQVVYVQQGGTVWGFSYGLPITRKPYGDTAFDRYPAPLVDGEARVIHDRLRERCRGGVRSDDA
jgi:hypothetical protein